MDKEAIKDALAALHTGDLLEKSKNLLSTLGYRSELTPKLFESVDDFFTEYPPLNPNTKTEQHFRENAQSAQIIFQVTEDEIKQQRNLFNQQSTNFNQANNESFLFCAVELKDKNYSRTKYVEFTREINKRLFAPTVIFFRAGEYLTIAFADRRPSKTDADFDVLGQVTLIKEVLLNNPHHAHVDILSELSLQDRLRWMHENDFPQNFDGLLAAWLNTLNTEELNKQFYRKLFAWYQWAVKTARFPTDEVHGIKSEEHVIRLITRLLFIWFIKEKGLVAEKLFNRTQVSKMLSEDNFEKGDSYYRVVLQNLFFATLNTEIDDREFRTETADNQRDFSKYRYKTQMRDPEKLLELFAKTPFINGGLFDCLDTFNETTGEYCHVDCFSDNQYEKLSIPNNLFFDKNRGLLPLLKHYKFTVEENTPIDQEVALDPELLGRVFENLLAAINPETGETVRKQTGSYYTPRPFVDYMVEETLIASLSQKCQPTDANMELWNERLHYLFDYAKVCDDASEWFDNQETDAIVKTMSELKTLDPAVGSGAFPMSVLHKLTLALRRLDPNNIRWEALQKELAKKRAAEAFNTQDQQERDDELKEISDIFERYRESDFGRKLYLIQNSIFGVDIQPIACQIAKLRFFISLAIEQEPDATADNFGIKPLPNLETCFIATNTLIGFSIQRTLTSVKAARLERKLQFNREQYFHATTPKRKNQCKKKDKKLRTALAAELQELGMFADDTQRIDQWDLSDQNTTANWFDPEWMFGIKTGFDIGIGNPPYIQLQNDGGRLAVLYESCEFDTFTRMGDIYCLFYEKAHKLLNRTGHLCFITSNKWMRAGYGKKLRNYFILHTQPVQLLDMGPGMFDATVDTNILLLQNNSIFEDLTSFRAVSIGSDFDKQTGNITQYMDDNGVDMEMPTEDEPWVILSSEELNIKRKIENVGIPLKDWNINIYRGIVTGCNEAFIIDDAKRQRLIDQDPRSAEIIKPILRGKDIKRYYAKPSGPYILATGYDLDILNDYPPIFGHLEDIGKQIDSGRIKTKGKGLFERDDQGENWWNLRACAYYTEFDKEKIVWGNIAYSSSFCYADPGVFINAPANLLTSESNDIKYLLACMNSNIFNWEFANLGIPLGRAFEWKKQYVELIHVPPITNANQHIAIQIEEIVDQILDAKQTNSDTDTSSLENEIDRLVYELYDLTPKEIAIVEKKE